MSHPMLRMSVVCLILIRHMGKVETSRLCFTCHIVQELGCCSAATG